MIVIRTGAAVCFGSPVPMVGGVFRDCAAQVTFVYGVGQGMVTAPKVDLVWFDTESKTWKTVMGVPYSERPALGAWSHTFGVIDDEHGLSG